MNPIFIYQNEADLKNNNKFTIDFSDAKFVHLINFFPKSQYYICSLSCNVNKSNNVYIKRKLVDDLSQKSRELFSKGAAYQNDIGYLSSELTGNYYFPTLAPHKYNLVLDRKVIDDTSYKFKFFDTTDKRMKFAKIYSPFSHFKSGFLFKGENDITKKNTVLIKLTDDYKKINCSFSHDANNKWEITRLLYRDSNVWLTNEKQRNGN